MSAPNKSPEKTPDRGRSTRPTRRPSRFNRLFRLACQIAIVCGLGIGTYLCLRPDPELEHVRWLPAVLTHWADNHGQLDNVPAFAMLAVPFMFVCNGRRARRTAIAWLAVFAATLELLQYFIPTRFCEWQDIACSWIGLALTWLGYEFACWAAWRIYQPIRQIRRQSALDSRPAHPPRPHATPEEAPDRV